MGRRATTSSTIQTVQAAASNTKTVKLRYADMFTLAGGGAGIGNSKTFRANSIFDPDFGVGGHQPMGHDQWEAFYHHYRVISSKISVQSVSSGTATIPVISWVELGAISAATLDVETAVERGRCAWKQVSAEGYGPIEPLQNAYDAKAFFGKSAQNQDHKAAFGFNPAEDVYFHVGYQPMGTTGTTGTQQVLVVIDYIVELTEPKQLAQS